MRILKLSLFILAGVLLQSCATFNNGSKQKMRITSNPTQAEVYLNGKQIGVTPMTYALPRKIKEANFMIRAEGYQPSEYLLPRYRKGAGMGNLLLLSMGLGFTATGIATQGVFFEPGSNFTTFGLLAVAAGAAGLAIDNKTQANWAFRRDKIESFLIRKPYPVQKDSCLQLVFSSVAFKISPGTKIGNEKTGKNTDPVLWQNTVGINDEEIVHMLNRELEAAGYNIYNPETTKRLKNPDLIIHSTVTDITYDIDKINYEASREAISDGLVKITFKEDCITTCFLRINWTIKDKSEKIILEKSTYTSMNTTECGGKSALLECYKNSLFNLTHEKDFIKAIRTTKGMKKDPELVSQLKINIPRPARMPEETSVKEGLKELIKSVVTVVAADDHGSGFFISSNGLIMTNFHVVKGAEEVKVVLDNGITLPAKVIATNPDKDLAILKIEGSGYRPLLISTNADLDLGGDVYAIGTPTDVDLGQTITRGIIGGKRRIEENIYIQTDVSISPGNSGGPLINSKGEVIGIMSGKLIGKGIEGIAFAIPSYLALDYLNIQYE